MERGIGYNVSLSYLDKDLRDWTEAYIRDAKPASMLMFDTNGDEADYVKRLARENPDTVFEYRLWIPDPGNRNNGDNQQLYLSAAEWVEKHRAFAGTKVYCTVNNEPNHGDVTRTCRWHIDVMTKAHAAGIRTAIGGYAYGHPNNGPLDPARPENWEAIYGPYDDQMRVIAASKGMAITDIHEYGNKYLRDAVPYLIGRYKFWQAHLRRKGIGPVYWIIGEHGWATIEADDKPEYWLFPTIVNSWGVQDWEHELARQVQDIWRTEYQNDPTVIGANLFTLSKYSWPRSSYAKAPNARHMMRKGFSIMATTPPTIPSIPAPKIYEPGEYTLETTQSHINLRSSTSADIGDIANGAPVTVVDKNTIILTVRGDTYTGQRVRHNGVTGFVALTSSFSLKPRVVTEPEPTDPRVIAVLRDLIASTRQHAAGLNADADRAEAELNKLIGAAQ